MFEHRMARKRAERAYDTQHHRLRALEFDLALAEIGLDAIETPQEIVIPERAAEFAVGDGFQADVFLAFDDGRNLAVFDGLELIAGDFATLAFRARLFQRQGAQQAADVIRAEGGRRSGAHFPHTSSASSTIMRSLAHCSSSASTLPSSVEAKPHCGDRHNWSSATYLVASSMRRLISSRGSSRPLFEVTRPSTSCLLPLGKKRNGSKPPARSLSYSRK